MYPTSVARSLVRRLSIGAALWVGTLGMIVASLALWQYWRASLRAVEAGLQTEALALAGRITVSEDLLEVDIDAPAQPRDTAPVDGAYYGVYDATGRLIHRSSPLVPEEPVSGTRDGHREVLVPGPHRTVILVGRSIGTIYDDLRRLAASLLLAIAAGAALALPVGLWLRRALARSVRQIDGTARSLTPGQPTRIDTREVDAEFAGVAAALNGAFDRLEHALTRERQLTSDASHELRTPVTTLVAETQWALDRPRTAEEYKRTLEVCARQGARMKGLVETLLTLARLDAGTLPAARMEIALREVADDIASELRPLASERQVSVLVEGQATAWANREQVRILLANLVANAIRYNHPEGSARIVMSSDERRTLFRVEDTGPGLDPALGTRVFERFWRADAARAAREGGHGLGLAISKSIVDAHGGTIRFESTSGRGTAFIVELPRTG